MCSARLDVGSSTITDEEFKEKLRQYSQFFDRLVELVPAKYYVENDREQPANTRFLKKNAKAEAKKAAKDAAKKRKRENLDPDSAQTTLDVQREQARKKHKLPEAAGVSGAAEENATEAGAGDDGGASGLQFAVPTGKEPSAGQLRERLQTRIEQMRRERKAVEEKKQLAKAAREWRRQASGRSLPGAIREEPAQAAGPTGAGTKTQKRPAPPPLPTSEPDEAKLSFGRLEVAAGAGRAGAKKKRGKTPSKAELLEAARAKAEQRVAQQGTREGRVAYEQDAWKSAMARARGERVLDDPKLLSRSLKKEEKLRQKKSAAWKERQGLQRKDQAAKQKKRADNLKARVDTKLKNKKDKREKKLLRAGFEGRRDTFIGSDK